MEDKYPLNLSQRANMSREGMRIPSRERQANTPEIRKKLPAKTGLSVSGQNFFNASQRDQPSENLSSTDDLMLASLNIAVDETAFISTTKADLLQLQEEINKMDIDGKIRNVNPSNILKKNHTYSMAKFLSKYSNQNIKTMIDKRLAHASNFDTTDLLKFMGVKSESDGLRKLFKMLGIFDLMLVKLTEYQTVSFLRYEQVFENLRKQLGGQPSTKTTTMDSGISLSRFQVDLANMERMFELFSYVGKLAQQNKSSGSRTKLDEKDDGLKNVQSVDDLYKSLRNGETFGFNGELTISLINLVEKSLEYKSKENSLANRIKALEKELNEKNSKLTTLVEFSSSNDKGGDREEELQDKVRQLEQEVENMRNELQNQQKKETTKRESEAKEKVRKLEYELEKKDTDMKKLETEIEQLRKNNQNSKDNTREPNKDDVYNTDYYIKMIKQIEDNYTEKYQETEGDNHKKGQELVTLRAKLETAERERDDYLARLRKHEAQEEKDARLRLKGDDSSFEAALREQFASMKDGFEEKIKSLTLEIQQIKKEKSLEVLELKKDLNREKENRELLLRKLQIYTKT